MKNLLRKILSISLMATTIVSTTLTITNYNVTPVSAAEQTASADKHLTWPEAPDTVSESVILIDADTGAILYEKNPYEKCYPASTTKILTGLLTIENCNMNETVTFSNAAANSVTWEDASLGTKAGEKYSVEQSLYALLLYSANEVAYGLAEHVGGSLNNFVDMMNARAKQLGAISTHFNNASGLYDPDHYTTAYDMAMIAKGCYNNSTFVNIDSTYSSYSIGPTNMTPTTRTFWHRHLMLKNREYYYEYCKGGKTGFTDQSRYTLVTFAEKNDMRLIAVCFKSTESGRFTDTRTLFDWGFANFQKITAASDNISSLLNHSNYYNSRVYNNQDLRINLNASNLTIPNSASISDISITVDNNHAATNSNGVYTTNVNFMYGSNTVGAATVALLRPNTSLKNANLPYQSSTDNSSIPTPKKCIVINVWIVAGVALIIFIIYYIATEAKRMKRRKRHISGRRTYYK
jgi:D-alanyl-D-alanine carboxypeptidase/D-alanyl-D-alanine carboxypeptidase (penicillin-binding protein 5/6)